jgi:hypothetical protein
LPPLQEGGKFIKKIVREKQSVTFAVLLWSSWLPKQ